MGVIDRFEEFEWKGARRYERAVSFFSAILYRHAIRDLRQLGIKGKYLEAGCGPGILAVKLAKELGASITAFDISESMVEIARERAKKEGVKVDFRVGDVEKDYFGEFDVVYSTFSLHHWENPEKGLKNLWRMVKPNGYLYILDARRGVFFGHGLSLEDQKMLFERAGIRAEIKKRFPFMVSSIAAKTL